MSDDSIKSFRYLEDLLLRSDGTRMTVEEAVKRHYGYRTVWVAALNSEIRDRLRQVRLRGYPPRIFLSYRWESAELKGWVRDLALRLRGQGFEVLLDQFQEIQGSHLAIPEYVSSVASCHYALVVITSAYCDVVGPRATENQGGPDGWVWDEHQWILRLAGQGLLQFFGVLKQGDRLPDGFGSHNTIDVRGAEDGAGVVAARFRYTGPELSHREQEELTGLVERSDALLTQGDAAAAEDLLRQHRRFADFAEHREQTALALAQLGRDEEAVGLAGSILREGDLPPRTILRMAGVLGSCGAKQQALQHLVPLAKAAWSPAQVHDLLGNFLDDLGSFDAAIHHLRYALACAEDPDPALLNNLGMAYRHAVRWREAEEYFAKALAVDPQFRLALVNRTLALAVLGRAMEAAQQCEAGLALYPGDEELRQLQAAIRAGNLGRGQVRQEEAGRLFTCDHCGAAYRLDPRQKSICGDCGALYGGPKFHCSCCANDGVVMVELLDLGLGSGFGVACPICRKGNLSAAAEEAPAAAALAAEPSSLALLATQGEPPDLYIEQEIAHALAPGNRCLLLCCLASVLAHADEGAARQLHAAADALGDDPGQILSYPLDKLHLFTAEVEPKQYAAGERIAEVSQVIRGAARIVNQLAAHHVDTADEIAGRFTWPRTRRLLLAGIAGCSAELAREDLADRIRAELAAP
jgi:tetratricopeptide (TPR) repeat protein